MTILNEIKKMGYTVRIHPRKRRLGVIPWDTCPPETRQWFTDNRNEIEAELRGQSTVGSQLKRLIERKVPATLRSKVPKSTCGCSDLEKKMNMWGIAKCQQESEYIISHLVGQSDKMGKVATVVPLVLRRKAAEKMLKLAIKMEQKAKLAV
tara:strand:+ start:58 stop:510 length:453 start_codon:yes stop_codon:yes gene_type:complete